MAKRVSYLTRALQLLENLPATTDHPRHELNLRLALASSLTALKGQSHPVLRKEYLRAKELALQVGSNEDLYEALFGLFLQSMTQGRLQIGHELAEQRLALAKKLGDRSRIAETCGSLGVIRFHQGEFPASVTFLKQAVDRSSDQFFYSAKALPTQHHALAFHRHLAIVLWYLGYPDQALEQMDEVLTRAERLSHPNTLGGVYSWYPRLHHYRREIALVHLKSKQAMAFCTEHGLASWHGLNLAYCGWAIAHQGQVDEGIAQISLGLKYMDARENKLHRPGYLSMLAEVYGRSSQVQHAVNLLNEAFATAEVHGDHFSDSELYRLKGEVLLIQGADRTEVESHYLQALTIARQQEAKSLELRAALSLSRLWQQQDKRQAAHALLAPLYDWFTEGFDTRDLIEARALLEEMS